eukprot:1862967-Pyramimonas_sp.AAC.1
MTIQNRSSHPWLTPGCVECIRQKAAAAGSDAFPSAVRACSSALLTAYHAFVERTRRRLKSLRPGSKGWWNISRELMSKVSKSSCPPLRRESGSWSVAAAEKAELFASSFRSKWNVPDLQLNACSFLPALVVPPPSLPPLRLRRAKH